MGIRVHSPVAVLFGVACACLAAGSALAQADFPTKPIRFLVGAAPGGATEIIARALGNKLAEKYPQQVLIDPRPGANHIIAGEITLQAPPDGHTIQMIPEGFVINASIYPKLPFDPVKDFTAIAIVAMVPNIMVVHPSLPARSVADFIALARKRPGDLTYGTSGVGSPSHMAAELFKLLAKLDYVHVPYKGQSLALVDLIGGHLQFAFPSIPSSLAYIKSARLRPLGVTTPQRASAVPDVPTIKEAGLPTFEVSGWYGVIGPKNMPRPLVERINRDINAALKTPELAKLLSSQGADPLTATAEGYAKSMAADRQKWADVVQTAGIKVQR
ncbi:MAG: tripartite tricarboxylate transporter substrate binding protein [Burkholderiales bacterium]|nr:tripartite tricarboxylate transporter substrate binding protein [Burkholderiales bacterium]